MSDYGVMWGQDAGHRLVTGVIESLGVAGAMVKVPSFDDGLDTFGPTPAAIGAAVNDEVLVAFDQNGRSWIVSPSSAGAAALGAFVGQVTTTALSTAAAGWLMCDGAAMTVAAHPVLRAALIASGNPYGVSGSDPLLPNLNAGRVAMGKNGTHPLGQTGGADTVTLSVGEMPSHNHGALTGSMNRSNPHSHLIGYGIDTTAGASGAGPNAGNPATYPSVATDINHEHSIASQGGGGAHSNLQPFVALNYVIYAGP